MYLVSKKARCIVKMPKSRTRNPLFSHPTNIWDLLRAKHCSRPLDTLVNKKAKRHRPKHHNSKELMKEKKKKILTKHRKIMKEEKYLIVTHLTISSHLSIATCKQTSLQVIPVMKHRNFKFLGKKAFAPIVKIWLSDKIPQNYILMKKGILVCQHHSQICYCYNQTKAIQAIL